MEHTSQQDCDGQNTGDFGRCSAHWTVPHKIMQWPCIYRHLDSKRPAFTSDLQAICQEGTRWFVEQTRSTDQSTSALGGLLSISKITSENPRPTPSLHSQLPRLCAAPVERYVESYFRTFNTLRPILDQAIFLRDTQPQALQRGDLSGKGLNSVLLLLVIALGQVAHEGITGPPVATSQKGVSGFRGGCALLSPGKEAFDEALRRWTPISGLPTLERVQALLLQATYHESSARHWDFWKCAASASASCGSLIKQRNTDWATHEGEMLKRAYWACVLDEGYYHHDLDLPLTGIFAFQDEVPLPAFIPGTENVSGAAAEDVDYSVSFLQFLATISLKRIVDHIHDTVHKSLPPGQLYHDPPRNMISELDRQLSSWRCLLPQQLQWSDDQRWNLSDAAQHPGNHDFAYNADIMIAELRARFYAARFTLLSPFLYRALHYPELMSGEDTCRCCSALESTFFWPMAVTPVKDQKRLVPHHFTWTQNAITFLCVFAVIHENKTLKKICHDHLDLRSLRSSVAFQLCWLEDLERVDGIARWAWQLLRPLFIKGYSEPVHPTDNERRSLEA